jgi:hypothetical protein
MTKSLTSNQGKGSESPPIETSWQEINTYCESDFVVKTSSSAPMEASYFSAYCTLGIPCSINVQVDFKLLNRQRKICELNKKFK